MPEQLSEFASVDCLDCLGILETDIDDFLRDRPDAPGRVYLLLRPALPAWRYSVPCRYLRRVWSARNSNDIVSHD
jgi:hypothetical protein